MKEADIISIILLLVALYMTGAAFGIFPTVFDALAFETPYSVKHG